MKNYSFSPFQTVRDKWRYDPSRSFSPSFQPGTPEAGLGLSMYRLMNSKPPASLAPFGEAKPTPLRPEPVVPGTSTPRPNQTLAFAPPPQDNLQAAIKALALANPRQPAPMSMTPAQALGGPAGMMALLGSQLVDDPALEAIGRAVAGAYQTSAASNLSAREQASQNTAQAERDRFSRMVQLFNVQNQAETADYQRKTRAFELAELMKSPEEKLADLQSEARARAAGTREAAGPTLLPQLGAVDINTRGERGFLTQEPGGYLGTLGLPPGVSIPQEPGEKPTAADIRLARELTAEAVLPFARDFLLRRAGRDPERMQAALAIIDAFRGEGGQLSPGHVRARIPMELQQDFDVLSRDIFNAQQSGREDMLTALTRLAPPFLQRLGQTLDTAAPDTTGQAESSFWSSQAPNAPTQQPFAPAAPQTAPVMQQPSFGGSYGSLPPSQPQGTVPTPQTAQAPTINSLPEGEQDRIMTQFRKAMPSNITEREIIQFYQNAVRTDVVTPEGRLFEFPDGRGILLKVE